jgi:uncharacterized protein YaaN involved in tellurite resistance
MALFSLTVPDQEAIRKELGTVPPEPAPPQAPTEGGAPDRGGLPAPAPPDPALAEAAARNAEIILKADPRSPGDRTRIADVVERFGLESMRASADRARALASSAGELARAGDGGPAASGLAELSRAVRALDPSGVDFEAKGLLGLFPPARKYFRRFEGAEGPIAEISRSMAVGRSSLRNDNITIRLEQSRIRDANERLGREIALGALLDGEISSRLDAVRASDPERASFLEQDVLFPLRQRVIDLQQSLAVNAQGLIAMEVVSRNNSELIRAVDRALTVTLAALRTSAAVAGALYNQRIALKRLKELDEAAAAAASEGASLSGPAPGGPQATVDRLKESFREAMSSLDEIDRFREGAAAAMRDSVGRLRSLAGS